MRGAREGCYCRRAGGRASGGVLRSAAERGGAGGLSDTEARRVQGETLRGVRPAKHSVSDQRGERPSRTSIQRAPVSLKCMQKEAC